MPDEQKQCQTHQFLEPTWFMSLRVLLSFMWRYLLLTIPLLILISFILGSIARATGVPLQGIGLFSLLMGCLGTGLIVVKKVLKLKYKEFHIVILKNNN